MSVRRHHAARFVTVNLDRGQPKLACLLERRGRQTASLGSYLEDCERSYIARALAANSGRIAQSAATLGISRKNLWEKLKKLGIQGG